MSSPLATRTIDFAIEHPRTITWTMLLSTLLLILLALLPSLWPQSFPGLNPVRVDTDPENMLSASEPVRILHDQAKKEFSLHDILVVGIVNERHPQGVFNQESLTRIYHLTQFARRLQWPDPRRPGKQEGVVEVDVIAPSTVDNIEQAGLGVVDFNWLMASPPKTDGEALKIRQRAQRIPFLNDTLVSGDGKAIALYLPLTSKDVSYRVRKALLEQTADWKGTGDQALITGLPVAEDTFGVEMFIQMAISAPLAMLVIFLLLWWFFKKLVLIISPMIIAMVCSLATMALLIISGNTIHIMSSMIPIFVMPIAVLDAVHILSEFFDRYPEFRDRRKTISTVMQTLFRPMLFTSLTTIAGFASLALTPIPPVQVFGIFIAIGVFLAWILTILFIPAFIMFIPENSLAGYGHAAGDEEDGSALGRGLIGLGGWTQRHTAAILIATLAATGIAGYGISRININDNPIKWFTPTHPIRIADRILNQHFGGTYMAYLELAPAQQAQALSRFAAGLRQHLQQAARQAEAEHIAHARPVFARVMELASSLASRSADGKALMVALNDRVAEALDNASDAEYDAWDAVQLALDAERQRAEVFKSPEVLRYMARLQSYLLDLPVVGKVNSLADVVRTVHRELLLGSDREFRIPDSAGAVAQTLLTYQNSHRPQDLWHFVTPDYRKSVMWLQLTSGDNQDMEKVIAAVDDFFDKHPPPAGLQKHWFGLTYINVVWQQKMVSGMLESFLGSFLVVLLMMVFLFRSLLWGLLAMIPLTVTVGLIYGVIGLIGKDYDMPVAVLSALSLGLAVDYAIHFLERSRATHASMGDWTRSVPAMFGEPARAITRNVIILGAGFLPLLLAPLIPYQTVGVFIAAIIFSAGVVTLLILPALIRLLEPSLFPKGAR